MKFIRKIIIYIILGVGLWIYLTGQQAEDNPTSPTVSSVPVPHERPSGLTAERTVDHIYIDKSARFMELRSGDHSVKRYDVALGFAPSGQKYREGDGKTPTGDYVIDYRNPQSSFYKSLHISYPRPDQIAQARAEGRNPGGQIMIHGQVNGGEWQGDRKIRNDWTLGCVSVSNNEMDEIWALVADGTPITIVE